MVSLMVPLMVPLMVSLMVALMVPLMVLLSLFSPSERRTNTNFWNNTGSVTYPGAVEYENSSLGEMAFTFSPFSPFHLP